MTPELLNCARHELGHVVLLHLCGYDFDGVELHTERGCTVWSPAVTPQSFPDAYEKSPLRASLALVQIVAIIRAGYYVELHAGQHGHAPVGGDLADIEAWRNTVVQMGSQEWWTRVYTESVHGLQSWYRHAAVQRCIADMAPVLADHRTMSRYAVLTLMEHAGVGSIPAPAFVGMLAPARYVPGATSTARRPATGPRTLPSPVTDAGWRTCCNSKISWGHAFDCAHRR